MFTPLRGNRPKGLTVGLLVLQCPIALADPPAPFTNEAAARGISYVVGNIHQQLGSGVALVDLDSDLDPDAVVVGRADGVVGVYENDGAGQFIDRSATSGIPSAPKPSGLAMADYDADGDLDIVLTNYLLADMLLRNEGGLQFTNVAAAAGINNVGSAQSPAFGDVNGDGWLDLFIANRTGADGNSSPNRLYVNNGDGTFTSVGETLGINRANDPTLVISFFDYDRDGDADLYLGNDHGSGPAFQNHLFEQVSPGSFVDVTAETGTAANVDCMGIAVGDLTHNRWQDLYVSNIPAGNVMLFNLGDGTFADETTLCGVESFRLGWATMFLDYDNDTWHEVYLCNSIGQNRMYNHDGVWPSTDDAAILDIDDNSANYCFAAADIENDGDLDLLVQASSQPIRLYVNHEGEIRQWVKFNVRGIGPNTFAVGAQIDIRTGELWQLREIHSGTNYKSQNEMLVHFGLGEALVIDEAVVAWPGGISRTLTNIPARETWTLLPTADLGDADDDDDVDLDDFQVFVGCVDDFAPGCEPLDFDGDWDLDETDYDAFMSAYGAASPDCDENQVPDLFDIAFNDVADANVNLIPDICECTGDVFPAGSPDSSVDVFDLLMVLEAFGPCEVPCPADITDSAGGGVDGSVDVFDILALLDNWGGCA